METKEKKKADILGVLVNLFWILLLLYFMFNATFMQDNIKAVALVVLMIPFAISLIMEITKKGRISDLWHFIFIVIAVILWLIHSFTSGKLAGLLK